MTEDGMKGESARRRARRRYATGLGAYAAALALVFVFSTRVLTVDRSTHTLTIVAQLVVAFVLLWLAFTFCIVPAVGYRAIDLQELGRLRRQELWHLTPVPIHDGDSLTLSPQCCRLVARAWLYPTWWARSRRATFVFAERPERWMRQHNMSQRRGAYAYVLDGTHLPKQQIYRRDGALAITEDFTATIVRHGPAEELLAH